MELDDQTKALLKNLGMALHQALTKDDQIKLITDQIKGNGYDIYLIMEANIALDRRDNKEEGQLILRSPEDQIEINELKFNHFDHQFLSGLKIKLDET